MCPPKAACIDEIGLFWTDEELFMCLERIQNRSPGASLPRNVVDDINPYLYQPSNLPEGIWYVIYSKDSIQTEVGFWKAKGSRCQIYSDSSVIGWRTTLEFYEGHSPNGHRTDWVMQEYSISRKGSSKAEDASSLCRVFLSDREGETPKMDHNQPNNDVRGQNNLLHEEDNKSGKVLMSNVQAEMERYQAMPSHQGDNLLQADCFANGDFLELLDLVGSQTSSSSAETSSCVSRSSDVYFDSDALLKELKCEDEVCQTKPSGYRFSVSKPNEVVVSLATEGSPINATATTKTVEPIKVEGSKAVLTVERRLHDKDHIPENAMKRPPPFSNDVGASSSGQKSGADKGKKVYCGKVFKKFCCFIAFQD